MFFCQKLLETAAQESGFRAEDRLKIGLGLDWLRVTGSCTQSMLTTSSYVGLTLRGCSCILVSSKPRWKVGFGKHEVTEAQPVVKKLGLLIDGSLKRVCLTPRRIWKLRLAVLALQRRRGLPPPKMIEKVVGNFTFAMLVKRETLSVFHYVYQYIRCEMPTSLWKLPFENSRKLHLCCR